MIGDVTPPEEPPAPPAPAPAAPPLPPAAAEPPLPGEVFRSASEPARPARCEKRNEEYGAYTIENGQRRISERWLATIPNKHKFSARLCFVEEQRLRIASMGPYFAFCHYRIEVY